jgi:hypothetical protein
MADINNLTYPKNAPLTEVAVDDYYDERALQLEAQYESHIRDIDEKIYNNDQKRISQADDLLEQNSQLNDERELLRIGYEQSGSDILLLEEKLEQRRNRYYLLESQWAQTENAQERDVIKSEAIHVGAEIEELEANIEIAEERNAENKRRYYEQDRAIVQKIDENNEKIKKIEELESKNKKLDEKKSILAGGLEDDIEKNEAYREKAKEKVRQLIPNDPRDVEFYTFGVYSDGTKRMGIVKVNAVINLPKDYPVTAIPNDVMLEIAKQAWQYIYDLGENPVPVENIEWDFNKPTSGGSATYFFADSYVNDDAITPELDGYSYIATENMWKRLVE